MKTTEKKYKITDREAGNLIDYFDSIEDAKKAIIQFEKNDFAEGIFVGDFYEITEIN
mgnify:CR=1 FL=1|jgi:hypothetical protein